MITAQGHGLAAYELQEILYRTEYFTTYRARPVGASKALLLKVPVEGVRSDEATERFGQEREIAQLLAPSGGLNLEEKELPPRVLMAELGDLVPLRRLLGSRGLPVATFLPLAVALARIVSRLHRRGIVHCDLNPDVLLADAGRNALCLLDFSRALRGGTKAQVRDRSPSGYQGRPVYRTFLYLAPEQTGRLERPIDARTDVYSLGVVLYELASGCLPVAADDPLDWFHALVTGEIAPPRKREKTVPSAVSDIIMRCLARDPEDRYQSALGVEKDLYACLTQWSEKGRVDPFPVGEWGAPPAFSVTAAFVGREKELRVLRAARERVAQGPGEVVLISGDAGTGKTRLARQFLNQTKDRGFVVSGKFEALRSTVPYKPLIDALGQALDRILKGSREEISQWQQIVHRELGTHVSAVAEMLPRLGELLGKPPQALPGRTVREAHERLLYAMGRLVQAMARQRSPLVLFLDDLQWADPESLEMLESLLVETRARHLLLIAAYRQAEAVENRRLMETLWVLERADIGVEVLRLESATGDEVTAVVSTALNCSREEAAPLAEFVMRQTGGNLLFAKELLESMHKSGLIVYGAGRWRWDFRRLQDTAFATDLVQFLLEELERLPGETRKVVQIAACVGGTFKSGAIAAVTGLPVTVVERHLARCRYERLVDEEDGAYRFTHDRIQQAAYLSLADRERKETHYLLGKLVLARWGEALGMAEPEDILIAANQINLGLAVLVERGESLEGAELNLLAGKKARQALAFSRALDYHRTGLSLLGEGDWELRYPLVFQLNLGRLECEYLCDNYAAAEELYSQLLEKARTGTDRAMVHLVRILSLLDRELFEEAIATGLQGLRELGYPLPAKPSGWRVLWALLRARRLLRALGPERVAQLESVRDERIAMAVKLMLTIGPCCYQSNQNLLALTCSRLCELSLRHGNAAGASYMTMAMVCLHSLKDYRIAAPLARAARDVAERLGSPTDLYVACFLYGAFILPWVEHMRESEKTLLRALELSLAAADLTYSGYAMTFRVICLYARGAPLPELETCIREYLAMEGRVKEPYFAYSLTIFKQLSRALQGLTRGPLSFGEDDFDEEAFYRGMRIAPDRKRELFDYCLCKGQLCYLSGEYRQALSFLEEANRLTGLFYGETYLADHSLYYSLAVLALWPRLSAREKATGLARVVRKNRRLRDWARHCPANFEHKYLLVSAELARVRRQFVQAATLYDRAIRSARAHGFGHYAAIACECAGYFYRQRGLDTPARGYFRQARRGYGAWGATLKVERLLSALPWLAEEDMRDSRGYRHPSEVVDMRAVYRASQILSGEIIPEELLRQMMAVVMQDAGADRGCFLLYRDGQLVAEAMAASGPAGMSVEVLPSVPLEGSGLVPLSVVAHAARGGDVVVLNEASSDERFRADPYLASRRAASILCLPVIRQGRSVGMLYLENSVTAGCFHVGRVEALRLLSAQIAISVDNAALYRSLQEMNATLEEKVRERTATLASVQKEAVETLLEKSKLEERNRIAREIHDTVGHTMTSVLVQIEASKRLLEKDLALARGKLERSQEQLRRGLEEVRRSLHLLREEGCSHEGVPDMEKLIREVVKDTGVAIDSRIESIPGLDSARKYVLYRALQEGITNGIRHGGSRSFHFSLRQENGLVKFVLRDFGKGAAEIRPGFGLTSMRERVTELNGTMEIECRAGEGCCITITLPLK